MMDIPDIIDEGFLIVDEEAEDRDSRKYCDNTFTMDPDEGFGEED